MDMIMELIESLVNLAVSTLPKPCVSCSIGRVGQGGNSDMVAMMPEMIQRYLLSLIHI